MMKNTLLLTAAIAAGLLVRTRADADTAQARSGETVIRVEGLQRTDPGTVFGALPFRIGDNYTDEKGETLAVTSQGAGGLEEFKAALKSDQASFGYVRMVVGNDELVI